MPRQIVLVLFILTQYVSFPIFHRGILLHFYFQCQDLNVTFPILNQMDRSLMNASWSLIQYPALFKRNDPRDGYDSHIDSGQIDYSFVIIQSSQSLYLKNQWLKVVRSTVLHGWTQWRFVIQILPTHISASAARKLGALFQNVISMRGVYIFVELNVANMTISELQVDSSFFDKIWIPVHDIFCLW